MNTAAPQTSSNRGFALGLVGLVALGLLAVAFVVANRGGGSETAEQTATVETAGDALVAMPSGVQVSDLTNDPAAGTVAPTLTATDFAGDEVTIGPDGRGKVVYFLAHWCPHCQEEVPAVQELIDAGEVPDGFDVYAVSTAVDAGRGNFPPQAWLEDENFTAVTVRDDADASAYQAFGGSGFPYAVYLDGENRVVARSAGNLPADATLSLWASAAGVEG